MTQKERLSRGVMMLREQGHHVEPYLREEENGGVTAWWKIDEYLATSQEIEHLADGIYSFAELEELYTKRRADEIREEPLH